MTNTNDSETKGPERIYIHAHNDGSAHPFDETCWCEEPLCDKDYIDVAYVRADLYTQSQRELEEAKREINDWKNSLTRAEQELRGERIGASASIQQLNKMLKWAEQERDRYREAVVQANDAIASGSVNSAWKILNLALQPTTAEGEGKATKSPYDLDGAHEYPGE